MASGGYLRRDIVRHPGKPGVELDTNTYLLPVFISVVVLICSLFFPYYIVASRSCTLLDAVRGETLEEAMRKVVAGDKQFEVKRLAIRCGVSLVTPCKIVPSNSYSFDEVWTYRCLVILCCKWALNTFLRGKKEYHFTSDLMPIFWTE